MTGIDKLESLQEHENEVIYNKSVHIIEAYFGGEEEESTPLNEENIQPAVNSNSFSFGLTTKANADTFNPNKMLFSNPAVSANQFSF